MNRVGLIIPSSNRMVEDEMVHHFPDGVQAHVTRLRMTGDYRVPLPKLLPRISESAGALDDAHCDVIAFHCTANSTEEGLEGEQSILEALRAAASGRVTTTATALRGTLDRLGAKRIVLITPYTPEVTEHESEFLRAAGYDVIAQVPKNLDGSDAYCSAPPAFWMETALAAKRDDADVYFLSCANISCMGIVGDLEQRLGRPVITSNQIVVRETVRLIST